MHQYSKFELDPYVNRYVWIETREGKRLQAYVQSVDNQFVELVMMEDTDEWQRNRPPYQRPPNQPWQPYHRPPYHRPPYNPPYHRPPYGPPYGPPHNRPPFYQQGSYAPFLLPLAALTAIGLLF